MEVAPFERQKLNAIVILINILQRHEEKQIKKDEKKIKIKTKLGQSSFLRDLLQTAQGPSAPHIPALH